MTEYFSLYNRKYKIFSAIFCVVMIIGAVLTLMKIKIGIIEGWTVLVVSLLVALAYLDGFIRKLLKQLKDKDDNV